MNMFSDNGGLCFIFGTLCLISFMLHTHKHFVCGGCLVIIVYQSHLLCYLASGTSRRPWVLGKVMEKEYCQAKKVLNSTKVIFVF